MSHTLDFAILAIMLPVLLMIPVLLIESYRQYRDR